MSSTTHKTALYDWHVAQGAKMVEFAGYAMPVSYPLGLMKEHLHTRASAGLFDVSHMGQVKVSSSTLDMEALTTALEAIFPADLAALKPYQQVYSLLLNEQGGVVDDLMICKRHDDYMLVINAGCKHNDIAYLRELLSDQIALELLDSQSLLALQGPKAVEVLADLSPSVDGKPFNFEQFVFMQAAAIELAGIDCFVTRSGYTGEDGFEISVTNAKVCELVEKLSASNLVEPVGLGARDSLRLEAGLCLYGHELNEDISPIQANLKWAIAKSRRAGEAKAGGFIAAEKIQEAWLAGSKLSRVALIAEGKAPVREGAPLFAQDSDESSEAIGEVVSGGFSPSLQKPIAMAYIQSAYAQEGDLVLAQVRKKQVPMRIVKTPFVANRYYRG